MVGLVACDGSLIATVAVHFYALVAKSLLVLVSQLWNAAVL